MLNALHEPYRHRSEVTHRVRRDGLLSFVVRISHYRSDRSFLVADCFHSHDAGVDGFVCPIAAAAIVLNVPTALSIITIVMFSLNTNVSVGQSHPDFRHLSIVFQRLAESQPIRSGVSIAHLDYNPTLA